MLYHSQKLDNERWGIFFNDRLIATIGCYNTSQKIINLLENRLSQPERPLETKSHGVNQYLHSLRLRT